MRLINTQARATQKHLKQARDAVLKAIESGKIAGLKTELDSILGKLPNDAVKLIKEIAAYEKDFTQRKIKKYAKKEIKETSDRFIKEKAVKTKIAVTIKKPKQSIEDIYSAFAGTKVKQLMQTMSDARVLKEEPEVTTQKVNNLTNGLFSHQNKSLAALAVIGGASIARTYVAFKNRMRVQWTADFESSNVCPYCEEMDGTIYHEETDDIPAHANCACTWTIIDGDEA